MKAPMQGVFLSANQLQWVARKAVDASSTDPQQSLVAILFSCAYVEAAVNELLHQIAEAEDGLLKSLRPIARASDLYERTASISRKVRVLGTATSGKEVDFGSQPLQDLDLLLELRNWLVHLRPELLSLRENPSEDGTSLINDEYHRLIQRLADRKVIKVPEAFLMSVTDAAQLPGVAPWSLRTAQATLDQLHSWIPAWRPPIVGKVEAVP